MVPPEGGERLLSPEEDSGRAAYLPQQGQKWQQQHPLASQKKKHIEVVAAAQKAVMGLLSKGENLYATAPQHDSTTYPPMFAVRHFTA